MILCFLVYTITSIKLVSSIRTTVRPMSICWYGDKMYSASEKGIEVIKGGKAKQLTDNSARCVRIYDDHIYTLSFRENKQHEVRKHSLDGRVLLKWSVEENRPVSKQLAIINGIIYIPIASKNAICRFTLLGESAGPDIKVSFGGTGLYDLLIAATPQGNLILNTESQKLVCINPETGDELWTRVDLFCSPTGLVSDNHNHIIVVGDRYDDEVVTIEIRTAATGIIMQICIGNVQAAIA